MNINVDHQSQFVQYVNQFLSNRIIPDTDMSRTQADTLCKDLETHITEWTVCDEFINMHMPYSSKIYKYFESIVAMFKERKNRCDTNAYNIVNNIGFKLKEMSNCIQSKANAYVDRLEMTYSNVVDTINNCAFYLNKSHDGAVNIIKFDGGELEIRGRLLDFASDEKHQLERITIKTDINYYLLFVTADDCLMKIHETRNVNIAVNDEYTKVVLGCIRAYVNDLVTYQTVFTGLRRQEIPSILAQFNELPIKNRLAYFRAIKHNGLCMNYFAYDEDGKKLKFDCKYMQDEYNLFISQPKIDHIYTTQEFHRTFGDNHFAYYIIYEQTDNNLVKKCAVNNIFMSTMKTVVEGMVGMLNGYSNLF